MNKVLLIKIAEKWSNPNGVGIGYWVYGNLLNQINIGNSINIHRLENSVKKEEGLFTTSQIIDTEGRIDHFVVETANSTYKMILLDEEDQNWKNLI